MKIENFMQALKEYQSPLVFNPWRDYDPKCDISSDAPVIRAANLTRYLQLRQKAHYLFIAEGLGYQGGHFSGMAMTSERILLGLHPDIKPEAVLGEWDYRRTSNPESELLKSTQKQSGFNEPTATVMWNTWQDMNCQLLIPFYGIFFPFIRIKKMICLLIELLRMRSWMRV